MTELQIIEKVGNEAVQKLRSGLPFMINSKDLEPNQFYWEYPEGSINLVFLKYAAKGFAVIRTLSASEGFSLRRRYGLFRP